MPESDWSQKVECDSSLSRIVVYSHEVTPQDAELLEQDIREQFDWINSVWVDRDAALQVTINLDTNHRFFWQTPAERYRSFVGLILHLVRSINWDTGRTALVYNGTIYRLNLT